MYEPSKLPEFSPVVVEMERTFSADLTGLIAWLETQESENEYCYLSNGHCLVAQFFTALGVRDICVVPGGYSCANSSQYHKYPDAFDAVAVERPRTFDAALSRARAALGSRP